MVDFNQEDKGKVALDIIEHFDNINLKEVEEYLLGLGDLDVIFVSRVLCKYPGQTRMVKIDSEGKLFKRFEKLFDINPKIFLQGYERLKEVLKGVDVA